MQLLRVPDSEIHHIVLDGQVPLHKALCEHEEKVDEWGWMGKCGQPALSHKEHYPAWWDRDRMIDDHPFVFPANKRASRCSQVVNVPNFTMEGVIALGTRTCKQCLRMMGANFLRKWGIAIA